MTRRFAIAALLLVASGCGSTQSGVVDYIGNYAESAMLPAGAVTLVPVTMDGARVWTLKVSAPAPGTGSMLTVEIAFAAMPATGTFSPASATSWFAVLITSNDCEYSAASDAVPFGSFDLTLDEVPTGDAGGPAHGTLTISQTVHAPPGVDCGPGDEETVRVAF